MAHIATNDPLNQPLEPKQSRWPSLSPKGWGLVLGGSVILLGAVWGIRHLTRPAALPETASAAAIAVNTLVVQPKLAPATVELSGTIRPLDQATLSTRVMGRITSLPAEAGDRFRKGDVLARIDVMDMTAQTSQAQSGVDQARAGVAQSQATLSQLQAQLVEAKASLRLAEISQRRMILLRREGAVSQSQLDEANTRFEEGRAKVAQIQAGITQAQAAIAQSKAALNRASSAVTSASANESYGTILAPFNGVVVQKLAYEGEMAAPGTALLKVENPDILQLEISVPEDNLRYVQVGKLVQVRVDAINQSFTAKIQQIVPAADPNSRSFIVKIPIPNSGRLISGMFGKIALPLGTQQRMTIPQTALVQRGQLQGVYTVVTPTPGQTTAELRWIKTGKTQNGQVEITSGLMPGDRLITNHLSQLTDGQPISILH
jgi:multidrug efflux pump subunit AcrA (membrane-fusion protein)